MRNEYIGLFKLFPLSTLRGFDFQFVCSVSFVERQRTVDHLPNTAKSGQALENPTMPPDHPMVVRRVARPAQRWGVSLGRFAAVAILTMGVSGLRFRAVRGTDGNHLCNVTGGLAGKRRDGVDWLDCGEACMLEVAWSFGLDGGASPFMSASDGNNATSPASRSMASNTGPRSSRWMVSRFSWGIADGMKESRTARFASPKSFERPTQDAESR